MSKIINGKDIALSLEHSIKNKINNIKLKLAIIQVGNSSEQDIYISSKVKLCNRLNIEYELLKYDYIEEQDLINKIEDLNNDKNITGILVELPLPSYLNKEKIINTIDYKKDVDGLTSINQDNGYILPCTVLAILEFFNAYNIDLTNKNITIVGYTSLIGIPLERYLNKLNIKPNICNSKTTNLKDITINSDIIISAVGKKYLITKDMIKENSILIDVGFNKVDNKIYGDISNDCIDKCSLITPVPGGIGPITVSMVGYNLIKCRELQSN